VKLYLKLKQATFRKAYLQNKVLIGKGLLGPKKEVVTRRRRKLNDE
jgi:hypothetical protein